MRDWYAAEGWEDGAAAVTSAQVADPYESWRSGGFVPAHSVFAHSRTSG